jgi:CheY-like chemotaxis protein
MARVLVVDDDVIVRTLLARRLRAAGFLVETAADGRAGLDSARTFGPDIVLTDWMMPEMDGPALVGALRADPALADTSVILITSRETHSRQASCETAPEPLAQPHGAHGADRRVRLRA